MTEMPIEITQGFVSSGGEDIYYESAGQGDAIIFCHGMGGNHASWFQQVPVFAHTYRTITWDQRGFGRSTNHGGPTHPTLATCDLKMLLDELGIPRAHLVGQSMGGWPIVGLALACPERVQSLVLADTFAGIYTAEIEQGFTHLVQQIETSPPRMLLGHHPALGLALTPCNIVRVYLYQQLSSFGEPPAVSAMYKALQQVSYPHEALKKLTCPVLCLVGSEDPLNLPAWSRQVAAVLPNAQVVEIPAGGHSPYFEDSQTWNQIVLDFLAGVRSPA